jgi:curved DNA binding protein
MAEAQQQQVDITIQNPDVVTKYKTAAEISTRVLNQIIPLCVAGAKVIDICTEGDKLIREATKTVFNKGKTPKGVGFPTCLSVNDCVAHFSPIATDPEAETVLKDGDVVKIQLGAQIDGYGAPIATTVIVGASAEKPVTGAVADALKAAHTALEAAIRLIKPGNKNMDVTKAIGQITDAFGVKAVEGMLTHQQEKDVVDGKKQVIINPSEGHLRDFERVNFAENEVYAVDILVSTGEGKTRQMETRTTVYKKTGTRYQLKMAASRQVLSEINTKFGNFPFSLRDLEDERKGRMGIIECAKHQTVLPYDILYERDGVVVQFLATLLLTKNGNVKVTSPPYNPALVKSDKELKDEELLKLLATPLKPSAKKNKKKKAAAEGAAEPATA